MKYTLLVKKNCPYSDEAIALIKEKKLDYEIFTEGTNFKKAEFKNKYGALATYPRIFYGTLEIGGYDDLVDFFKENS